ncbi:hypothetical protein MOQ95_002866 [Salmonella enterica]|nr:hypothetical protein [Salmonella enterica]
MNNIAIGQYFKLKKVVKILDNKIDIEDILNLAALGKIEISIFVPEFRALLSVGSLSAELKDWLLRTDINSSILQIGSTIIMKDTGFFKIDTDNHSNTKGKEWIRGIYTNIGEPTTFPCQLSGVWSLPPATAVALLRGGTTTVTVNSLYPSDHYKSFAEHMIKEELFRIIPTYNFSTIDVNLEKIIITAKQLHFLDNLINPKITDSLNNVRGNAIINANRRIAAIHAIFQILSAYHDEICDDKGEIIDDALLSKTKEDWNRIHGNKVKILNDKTLRNIIRELQERPDISQSIYIKPKQDYGK